MLQWSHFSQYQLMKRPGQTELFVCRLFHAVNILCIACEVVVTVCALVYLFHLRHSVDTARARAMHDRELALAFLSLGVTLATLAVTAVGTGKAALATRAAWARIKRVTAHDVTFSRAYTGHLLKLASR